MKLYIYNLVVIFFVSYSTLNSQTLDFIASDACFGDFTTLINTSQVPGETIKVEWDFNHDGSFDNGNGDTVMYYFVSPGYHVVGMRIVTDSGLVEAIYKQIYIGYFPDPDFSFQNACTYELTEFVNESTIPEGDLEDYIWDFDDGTPPVSIKNPTHVFTSPGIFNVKLITVSDLGCTDSIIKQMTIDDEPEIILDFIGDTAFFEGDSLIVTVEGYYDSIRWSNGYWGNTIIIKTSGTYTVTVYSGSCSASHSIPVTVYKRPTYGVMNVITPNGDGYNDRWQISFLDLEGPCEATIINRWGAKVFESSNYKNTWDGTYEGNPLQEGSYYYILKCDKGTVYKGPINIIR